MKAHEYVILDIAKERERQMSAEGWTHAHDDSHDCGELAYAAACYAIGQTSVGGNVEGPCGVDGRISATMSIKLWPWLTTRWKPKRTRENLIRAAALLVAEIERIDRGTERRRAAA